MDWWTIASGAVSAIALVVAINIPIAIFMLFLGGPEKAGQR